MEEFDQINKYVLQNESILLWVAIVLGVLFLGILAFDVIQRWRGKRRFSDRSGGWRRSLTRPFRRAGELRIALKEWRRHRAERRKWEEPGRRRRRHR